MTFLTGTFKSEDFCSAVNWKLGTLVTLAEDPVFSS